MNPIKSPQIDPMLTNFEKRKEELCNLYVDISGKTCIDDFAEKEVEGVVKSLCRGKAQGPDGIPGEVLIHGGKHPLYLFMSVLNKIKKKPRGPRAV